MVKLHFSQTNSLAFVLGTLLGLKDTYQVKSNRESGYGRYDVMLIPNNHHELGIIMEFKKIGRIQAIVTIIRLMKHDQKK